MKSYTVYRTAKGNLTFKTQEQVAYTIRAKSQSVADSMLKELKQIEKESNGHGI